MKERRNEGKKAVLKRLVILLAVVLVATLGSWAEEHTPSPQNQEVQENQTEKTGQTGQKDQTGGFTALPEDEAVSFMKSLMALTFVLGLIFLSAYLFKRITGIKGGGLRSNRVAINMVGNLPLGDKRFMAVVEIQGKLFLVGITPNSIEMLSELDIQMPEGPEPDKNGGEFENIFKKARTLLQKGTKG
jgi:flagellar protein FliO/FliZ